MNNDTPKPWHMVMRDVTFDASMFEELKRLNAQVKDGVLTETAALRMLTRTNYEVALDKWITNDPEMLKVKSKVTAIRLNSKNHTSVLITGPTGTGKELIAKAINQTGRPFVARNCAAIPKELIASTFFGHLKGTFTGATEDRDGILVKAGDGVVFLDEIAAFPQEYQSTLLRAIQEREVCRLGAVESIPIQCRFICATKHNLRQRVEDGLFLEDLFARLYGFELAITGLKDRPDDIPLIAKLGCDQVGEPLNFTEPIPDHVLPDIYKYNVRAIQTFVERYRTYGFY